MDNIEAKFIGRVGFAIGTGRCGTKFISDLMKLEKHVHSVHERNPLNETFHRYCKWYELPVDHGGFLKEKTDEIREDLQESDFSFEASAHLSFSLRELSERFGAKFIFLIRSPERVVNSYMRKGFFDQNIVYGNPELALGYQNARHFHHFLGRVVPKGDAFLDWNRMTRVGKIAWYWSAVNESILEQLHKIPEDHKKTIRLEDLNYETYQDICSFLGFKSSVHVVHFDKLVNRRPNALPNVQSITTWTEKEIEEFESHVGLTAKKFGYAFRIRDMPVSRVRRPSVIDRVKRYTNFQARRVVRGILGRFE